METNVPFSLNFKSNIAMASSHKVLPANKVDKDSMMIRPVTSNGDKLFHRENNNDNKTQVQYINYSPSKKKYVFALSPNKIKLSNIKKISLLKEDRSKNQISSRPSVSTRNTSKNISKYYEKVRNNNDNIEEIHFNFVKLLQREKKGINEDIIM